MAHSICGTKTITYGLFCIRPPSSAPKVRQAIDRQDFAGLMQLPQVEKAATNPELEEFLKGLALEEAMDTMVYQKPGPEAALPGNGPAPRRTR